MYRGDEMPSFLSAKHDLNTKYIDFFCNNLSITVRSTPVSVLRLLVDAAIFFCQQPEFAQILHRLRNIYTPPTILLMSLTTAFSCRATATASASASAVSYVGRRLYTSLSVSCRGVVGDCGL
uniref:Uncharacterized protein n=1 Tax=Syphacia muris TaxID=451379 RepID=A0A0N5AUB2_9BILA